MKYYLILLLFFVVFSVALTVEIIHVMKETEEIKAELMLLKKEIDIIKIAE